MQPPTRLLFALSLLTLLCFASAVSAEDDVPSTFYVLMQKIGMGDRDLVKIDTQADTLTTILTIGDGVPAPRTLEQFSPLEWQAFQTELASLPADQQASALDQITTEPLMIYTQNVWQTASGLLLIERDYIQCFSPESNPDDMPGVPTCYGGYEFSLLEAETQTERVIWLLPYHAGGMLTSNGCYTNVLYENYSGHEAVDQVLIHPTRPLLVVRMWSFGGCSNTAFIIDYEAETVNVTELSDIASVTFSPDAREMGYVQGCGYGTIDLTTLEKTTLNTAAPTAPDLCSSQWIAWPAADVLIFSKGAYSGDERQQTLVWHNRKTGEETAQQLPVGQELASALSVQDGETTTILALGDTGIYISHPNVALNATPGLFLAEDFDTPAIPMSANRSFVWNYSGLLDAHLTLHPIDLEPYAKRYGADSIWLAIIGVEDPFSSDDANPF